MGARIIWALLVVSACHRGTDDGEPLPDCEQLTEHFPYGPPPWSGERTLVVVRSDREQLDLVEAVACQPEGVATLSIGPWPEDAWLPPVGAQLVARQQAVYTELVTPDGGLVWAIGYAQPHDDVAGFRFVETNGPACQGDCFQRRPALASVQTDDGEVLLAIGEPVSVRLDGESFVAILRAGAEYGSFGPEEPCGLIFFGDVGDRSFVEVDVFRTTAVETPTAEPGAPPLDDCPVEMPSAGEACLTRHDLSCDYAFGEGCERQLVCRNCLWEATSEREPLGVDCGMDPYGCLDTGCIEPKVCMHCPHGADQSRWRCYEPDDPTLVCE